MGKGLGPCKAVVVAPHICKTRRFGRPGKVFTSPWDQLLRGTGPIHVSFRWQFSPVPMIVADAEDFEGHDNPSRVAGLYFSHTVIVLACPLEESVP